MTNTDANRIPLMFQAQIPDRGKIQYAGNVKPASQWVEQWLAGCPPAPTQADETIPIWKRRPLPPTVKLPKFGDSVETQDYKIRWRLITNSGQDEDVIRPIIGAKGLPFFPGSSMKGAFRRACLTDTERDRYCGTQEITPEGNSRTIPGILRFHGGYPVDMATWANRDRLVDVVHGQQSYQVMDNGATHSANVQISLYQSQFKFGISSRDSLRQSEWQKIWQIWERALLSGIGSRISAGYGYVDKVNPDGLIIPLSTSERRILSAELKGEGLLSQLLNKTEEFRPNLFKAGLRGHTLRLLAGITNETVAQTLTQSLWGGIEGEATVGKVGILFTVDEGDIEFDRHIYRPNHKPISMPTYTLNRGKLELLQIGEISPELRKFLGYLLRFSMLLGGFGKSWRRIHHGRFFPSYFKRGDKPMIGCHWEFLPESNKLWVLNNVPNLALVTRFLDATQQSAIAWLKSVGYQPNSYVKNWRETWHRNQVQVWGRIAKNQQDSQAVKWFHGAYFNQQSIKNTELTGWAAKKGVESQVGRIWHRMYPRYVKTKAGQRIRLDDEYIELLTLFPDGSADSNQLLQFLDKISGFNRLW